MRNYKAVVRIWNSLMKLNGYGADKFVELAEVLSSGGRVAGGILVRSRVDNALWVVCVDDEFAYPYNN